MNPTRIIGAGLSGLIAAHAWPSVPIFEAAPEMQPHRALLRFRSDTVARLTGIQFKKVLVRKGLWSGGKFVEPNIALANKYSAKVLGRTLGDRSIWNLEAVERWIAPEDFQERLFHNTWSRIAFNSPNEMRGNAPFVSTAPLPVALDALGVPHDLEFDRSAIEVHRFRVPKCDAHQTVYFPDESDVPYRASLTGDVLIVESMLQQAEVSDFDDVLWSAFGIDLDNCASLGNVKQRYGKIVSLPDNQRKQLLFTLTHDHGLYSLGRFAQWRNILLDDVVNDIEVIKRLMSANTYELRKAAS